VTGFAERWGRRRTLLLLALWMPVGQVALYVARGFGSPIPEENLAAELPRLVAQIVLLYLVGCLTATAFLSSLRRHPRHPVAVCLVYLPFVPIGFLLALAGGLLGVAGVIVGGTAPFVIPWGLCRWAPQGAEAQNRGPSGAAAPDGDQARSGESPSACGEAAGKKK